MVVVIAHEPSDLFLGTGLVLVDRSNALEFEDVQTASAFLARYASEPCYAIEDIVIAA